MLHPLQRNPALAALFALALAVALCCAPLSARADQSEKSWGELQSTIFGDRTIEDGSDLISLTAPVRAEDPALVPVEIKALNTAPGAPRIKAITLIVDENPAPLAALFTLAPDARVSALETRIRVNAYSFVRAIAETEDGRLHMVKRYVKATGGCAAPASKNPEDALASMGQMRLRQYEAAAGADGTRELQVQIRHPNYSGLQMDQLTGYYRPAHYVQTIGISSGGKPVMTIEGAISLSENPVIRFTYRPAAAEPIAVRAEDTEGKVFDHKWDASGAPGKES
jgi:sulfur-oxidizing protein SoxY